MTVTINYNIAGGGGGGGGGTGTITSVNGQTGPAVTLNALSVGSLPQAATNTWNASTNTPTLVSSTIPGSGILAYQVTVAGTTTLDGISTWNVGDVVYQTGTVWARAAGTPLTTNVIVGDGTGGLIAGTNGVQYAAPIVVQNCLELVMPSSGTMANNGAITLTTALQNILTDGCWICLPAGAIATGIPAVGGTKYWCVMSSTTVGTVYNNTYTPGTNLPTPPASPTPFVTTGPGAFTQVTGTDVTAYSYSVPAGAMGPNGSIDVEIWGRANNSAGTKAIRCFFGGQNLGPTINLTTGQQQSMIARIANKGTVNRQKNNASGRNVSGNASTLFGTVNTALAQTLVVNYNLAVNTDWVQIDEVHITVNYGA